MLNKVAIIFVLIHFSNQQNIVFEDRGYSGIFISIQKNVSENHKIVDRLKELFTNASEALMKSTNNMAYFKDITIEVPSTWSKRAGYEYVQGQSQYSKANFRIGRPDEKFQNTPFTLQAGGCGEEGQFVHLTADFILDEDSSISTTFGDLSKQILHEWAHLRYGVFDEYGEPGNTRYPTFYIDDKGKVRPTTCQADLEGWLASKDGGPCVILEGALLPDGDCRFVPNPDNNATSSLMYSPFIKAIERFCDDSKENLHNTKAPNKHNNICSYKPTWEVISSHPDFKGIFSNNRRNKRLADWMKPKFRVIHRKKDEKSRYILALDVSGSMRTNDRILVLREAASRFIFHRLKDGDYLGMLSFSQNVEQLMAVTKVNTATRALMAQTLPKETYDETAIGKVLLESIRLFGRSGLPAEGGIVILITDGEENVHPSITTVLPTIIESKMIVHTIAIGNMASEHLETLSERTGGKVFYFGERTANPTKLDEAFMALTSEASEDNTNDVTIYSGTLNLSGSQEMKGYLTVDDDLGINTKFLFTGKDIENLNISIVSPTGEKYRTNDRTSKHHPVSNAYIFSFEDAEPGDWEYTVNNGFGYWKDFTDVDVSLTSESREKHEPIKIKSWIKNISVLYPAKTVIYAHLHQSMIPVIHAKVQATVTGPSNELFVVILYDNGAGADIEEDDGIYSAFFTNYIGNGRYSVSVTAINEGGAILYDIPVVSKALSIPAIPNINDFMKRPPQKSFDLKDFTVRQRSKAEKDKKGSPAKKFQRASTIGSFKVMNWNPSVEYHIPPPRITDLEAIHVDSDDANKKIKLSWTSPQYEHLNKSDIDIRASFSQNLLLATSEKGLRVNMSTKDSLLKGPSSKQTIYTSVATAKVPKTEDGSDMNIYFSLRYVSPSGTEAELSNVAYVTYGIEPLKLKKIEHNELIETAAMPKIVGIVAGSIVGTIIIIFAVTATVKSCKKSSTESFV